MKKGFCLFIFIAGISCNNDPKEDPKVVELRLADGSAPEFSSGPEIEEVNKNSILVNVGLREQGEVIAAIRPAAEALTLTGDDLFAVEAFDEATKKIIINANITKTIRFAKLEPATHYKIYIIAKDKQGNSQGQTQILEAQTLGDQIVVDFLNSPEKEAYQSLPWTFTAELSHKADGVSLVNAPEWLHWDNKTNTVSGVVGDDSYLVREKSSFSFTLKIDSKIFVGEKTYTVKVHGDPLVSQSWHIKNIGQKSFAWFPGRKGYDLNVASIYEQGLTGKGVTIRIGDSGLQLDHPDLVENVDPMLGGEHPGCEINPKQQPTYKSGFGGDHGTSVAGIIAAKGWNNLGGRGIAPNAKIGGVPIFCAIKEGETLGTAEKYSDWPFSSLMTNGVDIVNMSFGLVTVGMQKNLSLTKDVAGGEAYVNELEVGRNGRGIVVVKSAGNGFFDKDNANMDPLNAIPQTIVVGAANALGERASYSSQGSNIWISAPGGERGYEGQYDRYAFDSYQSRLDFTPGVVTTDITDDELPCETGYSKHSQFFTASDVPSNWFSVGLSSRFNLGSHADNSDCGYTATFVGTSAASPMVAGVVALMLEKNPSLTVRDVKHILATTARQIDENITDVIEPVAGKPLVTTPKWITNRAGYHFHNYYGFGLIDAEAAINMADKKTYKPLPEGFIVDIGTAVIGDGFIRGGSFGFPKYDAFGAEPSPMGGQIEIPEESDFIVETVQLFVTITHANMSHIQLMIISPTRTQSVVLQAMNNSYYANFDQMVLLSNAFYGEPGKGTWKIKVVDALPGAEVTSNGYVQDWALRFTGRPRGAK